MKVPVSGLAAAILILCGCATDYAWRPTVKESMRRVAVPTFRNETTLPEIGAVSSRQILREIQREGTFAIASVDDAALEIQGVVKSVGSSTPVSSRRIYGRTSASEMTAEVEVSVIDKREGRVLVENRLYRPRATYMSGSDVTTAQRDAAGRLADDLARQVVDDLLALKDLKD